MEVDMNYFEVTAKCGHVGRDSFYKGLFYVQAENGSEAALKVRYLPRVKHDHKDAILSVSKISFDEFKVGQAAHKENPFFSCSSVQEQREFAEEIAESVHLETGFKAGFEKGRNRDDDGRRSKQEIMRRLFRKSNKFAFAMEGAI
jgi:hypothetical protein